MFELDHLNLLLIFSPETLKPGKVAGCSGFLDVKIYISISRHRFSSVKSEYFPTFSIWLHLTVTKFEMIGSECYAGIPWYHIINSLHLDQHH